MPNNRHSLTKIDEVNRTADCAVCGKVEIYCNRNTSTDQPRSWFCKERLRLYKRAKYVTSRRRGPSHSLREINEQERTGVCLICGPTKIHYTTCAKTGRFYWYCKTRFWQNRRAGRTRYRKHIQNERGLVCTDCGFTAEHPCQIDTHHVDKNKYNNSPKNRKSVCANCHRYLTWAEHATANRYTPDGPVNTYVEVDLTIKCRPRKDKQHKLAEKNTENMTAVCSICGPVKLRYKKHIRRYYCGNKFKESQIRDMRKRTLQKAKQRGLDCRRCGFQAKHACQIDWHHLNGDHQDNRPENREPWCVNCHRLETQKHKHFNHGNLKLHPHLAVAV